MAIYTENKDEYEKNDATQKLTKVQITSASR